MNEILVKARFAADFRKRLKALAQEALAVLDPEEKARVGELIKQGYELRPQLSFRLVKPEAPKNEEA